MLDSDLLTSPLEQVLLDLGAQGSTGCLYVTDVNGEDAEVYLRDGLVYSVFVPGRRPLLGSRLMSSGSLAPETLAEALEIQRTELQGWRLGELLVYLGFVDREVVESFVSEQLVDMLMDLLRWPVAQWKFRKNKKARQDVAPPQEVHNLLGELRKRHVHWERMAAAVGGPDSVPMLSGKGGAADDVVLGPGEWAMLCKVDGERSLADLASDCGFTVYEAAQVIYALVEAQLVEVDAPEDESIPYGSAAVGPAGESGGVAADDWTHDDEPSDAQVADSVARVTRALEGLLAPAINKLKGKSIAEIADEEDRRLADEVAAAADVATEPEADREANESGRRRREAVQIASEVEEARQRELARIEGDRKQRSDALRTEVEVDAWAEHAERLAGDRAAAEIEAWRFHKLWLAEQRAEAEDEAWADHAVWITEQEVAHRLEAEIEAWAEHAVRLEAERVAAEPLAWADHQIWLADQRAGVEDEAWADHAAWLQAERAAVEPQAWADHEEYLAEVARVEAELLAAAEAARIAAEAADRLAAQEAARIEAEEAARAAAERAARLEAERLAAEEAALVEAERIAAEEEAARVEAEEEAARVEAEETARLAAEEAARVETAEAAVLEAERYAAEAAAREESERLEAERYAAEEAVTQEAERLEAEQAAAEQAALIAAEEAARQAAEDEEARLEAERAALEADRLEAERALAEQAEREVAEQAEAEAASRLADVGTEVQLDLGGDQSASSLLTQLNAEASTAVAAAIRHETEASYEAVAAEVEQPEPVAASAPEDLGYGAQTDTAALLRELSGLFASGNEDAKPAKPPTAPGPSGPPRPPAAGAKDDKKKKRGLFGR